MISVSVFVLFAKSYPSKILCEVNPSLLSALNIDISDLDATVKSCEYPEVGNRDEVKESTVVVPLLSDTSKLRTSIELNVSTGPSVVIDVKLLSPTDRSVVSFMSLLELVYVVRGFIVVVLSVVTHNTSLGLSNILKSVKSVESATLLSSFFVTSLLYPLKPLLLTSVL